MGLGGMRPGVMVMVVVMVVVSVVVSVLGGCVPRTFGGGHEPAPLGWHAASAERVSLTS